MRGADALVLFPEGGNFTERRRRRAIRWLRHHGEHRRAAHAALDRYVLPPRTAGTLAALAAAPGADVVFVAHTGLDGIDSLATAWNGIPLRHRVHAHWWRVPAADLPTDEDARTLWLLDQWDRVDDWVRRHREAGEADEAGKAGRTRPTG
ncbi:hypothetical protein [Kitasatospora mediocidica]|uniref:hypothetical protein n=1 Tax=Kitasatospora mediocidica TaxID=58352 RepID=UPI00068E2803|nr:hypothetical protein [Kitasatospora mediocidica]